MSIFDNTNQAINIALQELASGVRSGRFKTNGGDYAFRETALDFWVLQQWYASTRTGETIAFINHYGSEYAATMKGE